MNLALAIGAVLTVVLVATSAAGGPPPAKLAPNRMLQVAGRPRFVIGLYEHPADDARLKEAVDAGFNLIHCSHDTAALDRVHRLGAFAWLNTGYALDLSVDTEKRKSALANLVKRFGSHPALLIWEGPDEALWNCWYGPIQQVEMEISAMRREVAQRPELRATLDAALDRYDRALWKEWERLRAEFWRFAGKPCPYPDARMDAAEERAARMGDGFSAGARYLRQLDPAHYLWLNHAPRNSIRAMRQHNRGFDMAGCDIYPVPGNLGNGHSDLPDKTPSSVGVYTDRMREAAPGKACAMVLQGFGWRDLEEKPDEARTRVGIGRRPTYHEQRFMAWDAIVHGANAILYWGTAYLKEPQSEEAQRFWKDILAVVREVRSLEEFIVAPDVTPGPSVRVEEHYASNDGTGVLAMVKKAGDAYLIVVVNENPYGVAFSMHGLPAALEGCTLAVLGGGETSVRVGGRSVRDGIGSYGVRLYKTSR